MIKLIQSKVKHLWVKQLLHVRLDGQERAQCGIRVEVQPKRPRPVCYKCAVSLLRDHNRLGGVTAARLRAG